MPIPAAALDRLGPVATGVLRYGLVLLLLGWGGLKFARFEAEAIVPLISGSPLTSWMYSVFDVSTASALIGTTEIALGLGMACRRFSPRVSGLASLGAAATFLVTLSFLFTTPEVRAPGSMLGGFLIKDLILFGAGLHTAAEALRASA